MENMIEFQKRQEVIESLKQTVHSLDNDIRRLDVLSNLLKVIELQRQVEYLKMRIDEISLLINEIQRKEIEKEYKNRVLTMVDEAKANGWVQCRDEVEAWAVSAELEALGLSVHSAEKIDGRVNVFIDRQDGHL